VLAYFMLDEIGSEVLDLPESLPVLNGEYRDWHTAL